MQTLEGCYSFPKWWIDLLQKDHPKAWRQILLAQNAPPPMTLRVNTRQISREHFCQALTDNALQFSLIGREGVVLQEPVSVDRLPGFWQGWVSVQDASAQWAAELLPLRAGDRVLDACAAPGGKTAHLLEREDVSLWALDQDPMRLKRVEETLKRLHLSAEIRCANALDLDRWWDGQVFDHILLDAPCSGSGVTRRHPDIRWLRRREDLERLARTQLQFIQTLWKTLRPGGTLLYITCSVFRQEGPEPVQQFLAENPSAGLLKLPEVFTDDGFLYPDERHDGFFYAHLRKT
jgi:16S rRNA (cytosine967-C5)-methyltransferase